MDKELKKSLDAAKKSARNFALLYEGKKTVHLIVDKKKIQAGAINSAKKEFGGKAWEGVVRGGEGGGLLFESLEESPVNDVKLKDYIADTTDLRVSVAFAKVDVVSPVKEDEEEGGEEESQEPVATETAPKKVDEKTEKELKEIGGKIKSLQGAISAAIKRNPSEAGAIMELVKAFKSSIDKNDLEGAKAAVEKLNKPLNDFTTAVELMRKTYVEKMEGRYEAFADEDPGINLNGFLDTRKEVLKRWNSLSTTPITKPDDASLYEAKQQALDSDFRALLPIPEQARKKKAAYLAKFEELLTPLVEYFDAIKNSKIDGKNVLEPAFDKSLQEVKKKKPAEWSSEQNFEEMETTLEQLTKTMETALKALADYKQKQLESGQIKLSFDGKESSQKDLEASIKAVLPQNGHGNMSGALNDALLGRGKATTGHAGVLHASAGKAGAAGGCTLFFTRDAKGNVDIVGVGQHKTSTSYNVYHGLGLKGKVLSL